VIELSNGQQCMTTTSTPEGFFQIGSQRKLPWLMLTDAASGDLEACARDRALSVTAAYVGVFLNPSIPLCTGWCTR